MYKAVVFDMDGVLVDTEKIYRQSWKKNAATIGMSEDEMEIWCDWIAGGNTESNARLFKSIRGEDFDYLAFRQRTMNLFNEHVAKYGIDIKPYVEDTLKFLKEKGIKIAVATSTSRDRAKQRLESVHIAEYFDEMVCGDEIVKGKPDPDIYYRACEKLGIEPKMAVAVEDSMNGLVSASIAGLHTVMVVDLIKPNETTEEYADETLYDIRDMWRLFQ